ncbi:MAG: rod shape-determining protein [Candidatus Kerfeldbacteria bacterium]|nr:rod shape-determining protein [Candidatus Kerfeldbacteria bacterium]
MLNKLFGKFSRDMGIDLGTKNTLVYVKDKGIVINEPSVVAVNTKTDQILAVGEEARRMVGKTPSHIVAIRPLINGVISDFEVTERMLKHFIDKVHHEGAPFFTRPRVVIGIPLGVTEVERKAVEDATLHAGAREVFLIEEPMAAAIGARLPIQDASGNMIADIGGGTTEIAVISLGGIVSWRSLRVAGNELDQNIIQYAREHFNLLLGERTAEDLKMKIGGVTDEIDVLEAPMRGRDLLTGLPKEVIITTNHLMDAMTRSINLIIENIKTTIEATPPELVADIFSRGIYLTGGGALLRGFAHAVQLDTHIPVHVVDDPLTAVVRGTGIVLDDLDSLRNILVISTHETNTIG